MKCAQRVQASVTFSLLLILGVSCAPEGDMRRTIHPPHKKFSKRGSVPASPSAAAAPIASLTTPPVTKGLPETCSTEASKQLCIHCQSDVWTVNRCYDAQRPLDFKNECQYSNDHVKCLAKNPPFALYIDRRASDEKFLRENFLVWQTSVHDIWDGKSSPAEKAEGDRIMQALDALTRALSTQLAPLPKDAEHFNKALGITKEDDKAKAFALINALQRERLDGKITLSLVLDKFSGFYRGTHGTSTLWEGLRTMNLEGLED